MGGGVLSDGAEREGRQEPEAPSDTRGRTSGGWGASESPVPRGGGDALCPGADEGQRPGAALAWDTRQVAEARIPGRLASLSLPRWGGSLGSVSVPQPWEGVPRAGPAPGPCGATRGPGPRRGRGRAPRREALFHFPALLRFLRSVSLTSLNFTALGLWPPGPALGRKRVLGLGSYTGRGVAPPGRARVRPGAHGAPGLCGAPGLRTPLWLVPGTFREGGVGCPGPGGGVCLREPQVRPRPLSRLQGWTRLPTLPESIGVCVVVRTAGRGHKRSRNRCQPWVPFALPNPPHPKLPLGQDGTPKVQRRGQVLRPGKLWSLMARPSTCLEIRLGGWR